MQNFKTNIFPKSRIATNDICAVGIKKHHIALLIEINVTYCREKIKLLRNMTIMIDHDVVDGVEMAGFIKDLSRNIEKATFLTY